MIELGTSESVFEIEDSTDALRRAEKEGWDVVFPQPNQLQIDIDTVEQYKQYQRFRNLVDKEWGITRTLERPSKSGFPRRHITLTLSREVRELERVALQSVLGSDPMREMYSLLRLAHGDPRPTLFFELPEVFLGGEG